MTASCSRAFKARTGSAHGGHDRKHARGAGTGATGAVAPPIKTTDIVADAQELRFVPRVYTTDYSPIIRAAQEAVVKLWGWRPDMPVGNFLDTVIFLFFEEKGITLARYIISNEARVKHEKHDKWQKNEKHGKHRQ